LRRDLSAATAHQVISEDVLGLGNVKTIYAPVSRITDSEHKKHNPVNVDLNTSDTEISKFHLLNSY